MTIDESTPGWGMKGCAGYVLRQFPLLVAIQRMKRGEKCRCIATDTVHWYSAKEGMQPAIMESCFDFECVSNLSLQQIESVWEEV